jgi:hypothetical protein
MKFITQFFTDLFASLDSIEADVKQKKGDRDAREQRLLDPDYLFHKWVLSISKTEWSQIKTILINHNINADEMLYGLYSVHSTNTRLSQCTSGVSGGRQKFTNGAVSDMISGYVHGAAISNLAFPEKMAKEFAKQFSAQQAKDARP